MIQTFKIGDEDLCIDTDRTRELYLEQTRIVDDCSCDDCLYFSDSFIKEDLEIFRILHLMGVDLGKNLTKEPTGVWCIEDDNGFLLHCSQVYQVVGSKPASHLSEIVYEATERGFEISARFIKSGLDSFDVVLQIGRV